MAKILIYLHGLGSKGDSPKSRALTDALRPLGIEVIAPDLELDPILVIKQVRDIVYSHDIEQLTFCGTSLGGFYAAVFGEVFDAKYVAVNPAISPATSFERYLTNPPVSWVDGKPILFNEELLASYRRIEEAIKKPSGYLANIFVAEDDDVVPYKPTVELFKYASFLECTSDGGHRYDLNWDRVIARVKDITVGEAVTSE